MRSTVVIVVLMSTMPASANCRLPPSDCRTLFREMSAEAEASADDERHFHPAGLSRYERATALVRRHLDRVDERSFVLPRAIGDEWSRIEACSGPGAAADPGCP